VKLNKPYIYKILDSHFFFVSNHRTQGCFVRRYTVGMLNLYIVVITFAHFNRNRKWTTSHKMCPTFTQLRLDGLCRKFVLCSNMRGIFCALYMLLYRVYWNWT